MIKVFDDTDIFKKNGIYGEKLNSYTANNVIVGENGSGKSRFLKGVYEYYVEHLKYSKEQVVYAYFPALSGAHKVELCEMEEPLFQSFIGNRPQSFDNFVRCIEADTVNFIKSLFSYDNTMYRGTREKCTKARENLNSLLKFVMNYEISDGEATNIYLNRIDSQRCTIEKGLELMSPGERVLFYLTLYLFFLKELWGNQGSELILILDEPELHLHVKALHKFVRVIKQTGLYTQLWIATHSYTLAAEFEFTDLIYIEDGKIQKRNSKLYYNIYKSLIGIDDSRLYDFLTDIEKWQYYNFITECFMLPESVDKVDSKDVQFRQFLEFIKSSHNPIAVLDYGAGKERLYQCMKRYAEECNKDINSMINYFAYDGYWEEEDIQEKNWRYNDIKKLTKKKFKQFDCVVLMNTLHEIDIVDWSYNFSAIRRLLKDTGKLLFVEVETLTHGEQPYGENGYLILYEKQLKILFNTDSIECIKLMEDNNRSNAFLISSEQVSNVTSDSVRRTLESLQVEVYKKLEKLNETRIKIAHKGEKESQEGLMRKYAFYSQLYINAVFAIQRLHSLLSK